MYKFRSSGAVIFFIILSGTLTSSCVYDRSGCGLDDRFEGCFERVDEFGQVELRLHSECSDFLEGTLIVDLGPSRLFAVEGKSKPEGFLALNATDLLNPDRKFTINVFHDEGQEDDKDDDTVTLQIVDEPPLGPLPRCQEGE